VLVYAPFQRTSKTCPYCWRVTRPWASNSARVRHAYLPAVNSWKAPYPRLTRPEPDQRRILGTLPPLVSVASAPRRERILFVHCQFITWSRSLSPLGGSLSTPTRHLDDGGRRTTAQPDAHGLPREAGGRQSRLLGAHVGFPNRGLRLQPAATGRPG